MACEEAGLAQSAGGETEPQTARQAYEIGETPLPTRAFSESSLISSHADALSVSTTSKPATPEYDVHHDLHFVSSAHRDGREHEMAEVQVKRIRSAGASEAPRRRTPHTSAKSRRRGEDADTRNRYQCRYPNCGRLYLSTDAARKHCRKSHFNWLRGLDEKHGVALGTQRGASFSEQAATVLARLPDAVDGQGYVLPKPAIYCSLVTI